VRSFECYFLRPFWALCVLLKAFVKKVYTFPKIFALFSPDVLKDLARFSLARQLSRNSGFLLVVAWSVRQAGGLFASYATCAKGQHRARKAGGIM
jgi:hypothetical protein